MSVPYTQVTSIHYKILSKNGTIWKTDVNRLSVHSFQGLLFLFFDKHDDFAKKNYDIYKSNTMQILIAVNAIPHQFFAACLQVRDIFPNLKKGFYKELLNVSWEEFLTSKFELSIDTRSSTDNTFHGRGKEMEESDISLQTDELAERSDGDLTCNVFGFEDGVAYLAVSHPRILTIEK